MLRSAKKLARRTRGLLFKNFSNSLHGYMDSPKPQGLRPGVLNSFAGWVFDQKGTAISGIEVFQNGKRIGLCDYGHTRDDVYRAYPDFPQAATCGFSGWVRLQQTSTKPVCVYLIYENGSRYLFARRKLPWKARVCFFLKRNKKQAKNKAPHAPGPWPARDIPRKILIAGMAKTGTTGLFFKISNSIAAYAQIASETKFLFEPTTYRGAENERVVAKIIIQKTTNRPVTIEDFTRFNKKILLIRDPRDQLISSLLYSAQGRGFKSTMGNIDSFLGLLEQKEQNPASVSILDLAAELMRAKDTSLKAWQGSLAGSVNYFLDFQRGQTDFFWYKYEDFVENSTRGLEDFLGFSLAGAATVEKALKHVVRTKKSGDWQNWFTEKDIAFFKPVYQEFMQTFGYEDSWLLPDKQVILPDHASEYVRKNLPDK